MQLLSHDNDDLRVIVHSKQDEVYLGEVLALRVLSGIMLAYSITLSNQRLGQSRKTRRNYSMIADLYVRSILGAL